MRLRLLFLPALLLVAAWSCRSQESSSDPESSSSEYDFSNPELAGGGLAEDPGAFSSESGGTSPGALGYLGGSSSEFQSALSQSAGGQDLGSDLGQDAERISVLRQRAAQLSSSYTQTGDDLLDRADLEGALKAYATALEIQPSNQSAREGMRRVETLMGDRFAVAADFMEDALTRETVRRQQARMEAERNVLAGDVAMRDGDYQEALNDYRTASLILGFHPLIATDSLDELILRNKIDSALGLLEQSRFDEQRRVAQDAEAARMAAEEDARDLRENRIRALYAEAWGAFGRENYSLAEDLTSQVLLMDPGNEDALLMRDVSQEARHQKVEESTLRDMREQWILTMEGLDILPVPQTETLVFDDIDRWLVVDQRQPRGIQFSTTEATYSAETDRIAEILRRSRIAPKFGADGEGAPLEEVATFLQSLTGVNFVISTAVSDDLDEEETSINLDLPDRSVLKVLELIADLKESLRWKIEDGVVKFVTIEEMIGGQVLRMFDVQDLIHPVRDFPGREINVEPSGGLDPFDEDFPERDALVVTQDSLEALIRDNVDVESWDNDPNNNLRITDAGVLVVYQTPEVQEKITRLLDDLREATGIMVDIQTRFMNVEDNFLEDIGVDFRGLGSPGLGDNNFFDDFGDPTASSTLGNEIGQDTSVGFFYEESGNNGNVKGRIENLFDADLGDEDILTPSGGLSFQWVYLNDLQMELILRAVSKSERIEIVTAPRLLVFNTARANLTVMNQVAYVQDFDVEIAQGASIADPIVNVVQDGVVLDVRPVVSADRRFITLELRPTVATLRRPIREVTTTLGAASSVTIQLPELEIARVRTSVPMPDGGTVMLGGLKLSERQDLRSGVPVLSKIPVLSLLFERKGNFLSKRKLLILLRAGIVIPAEHEPTDAQMGLYEDTAR